MYKHSSNVDLNDISPVVCAQIDNHKEAKKEHEKYDNPVCGDI